MTSFAEYTDGSGELSYFLNGADGVQPEREDDVYGVCEECGEDLRGQWIGAFYREPTDTLCGRCYWAWCAAGDDS